MTADPITPEVEYEGSETFKIMCDPKDAHRARASSAMPELIPFRGLYSNFDTFDLWGCRFDLWACRFDHCHFQCKSSAMQVRHPELQALFS